MVLGAVGRLLKKLATPVLLSHRAAVAATYDMRSQIIWAELNDLWVERKKWRPDLISYSEFVEGATMAYHEVRPGLIDPSPDVSHLKGLVSQHLYDIARIETLVRENREFIRRRDTGVPIDDSELVIKAMREDIKVHPLPPLEDESVRCFVRGLTLLARVDPIPRMDSIPGNTIRINFAFGSESEKDGSGGGDGTRDGGYEKTSMGDRTGGTELTAMSMGRAKHEHDFKLLRRNPENECSKLEFMQMGMGFDLISTLSNIASNPNSFSAQQFNTADDRLDRPECLARMAYTREYHDAYMGTCDSESSANNDGGREPPDLFLEVHVTMAAVGRVPIKTSYVPSFYTSVATLGGGLLEPREHRPGAEVRRLHHLVFAAPLWTSGEGDMGDFKVMMVNTGGVPTPPQAEALAFPTKSD